MQEELTNPEAGHHGRVFYRAPQEHYPVAHTARGVWITDRDGRSYLDMSGGAAVSAVGHGHPAVVATVHRQVERLAFAHTAFFSNEPQEELAERLVGRFGDDDARVYFLSGGSEANETALKFAWQYWAAKGEPGKKIIISREHSYHGNTFGALSISGNAARRRASAAPLLDWPRISPCYSYRGRRVDETVEDYALRSANELQDAIDRHGKDQVAAFIAEPVVGSSLGVVPPVPGYFARIREICDANDILLIADEIMCGSGRIGRYFAHQAYDFRPDIVTLAKGIGGGYQPLAATIVAGHIAAELTRSGFAHGHTYVGHATACAAGVAVQETIDKEGLLEQCRERGDFLWQQLNDSLAGHPRVGDIRVSGLFAGIELVSDRQTRAGFEYAGSLADALRHAGLREGLIAYPGSIQVDGLCIPHIMLAPPLIATTDDLTLGVERVRKIIDDVLGSS